MLWYKAWLDTRWRFLLGLALLLVFACGTVASYSTVQELVASVSPNAITGSEDLRQEFEESLEIMRTFRGYIWLQWFQQNFSGLLTIFAALLGSGSPLVQSGSGALFSLALPVSRGRWITARAGAGLAELLVLALAPSVAFAALAPFIGEQLSVGEALVYGACAFVGASVLFSVAVFISSLVNDVWRPLLLTCLAAVAIGAVGLALPEGHGLYTAMAGGRYFEDGSLPWIELLVSAAVAAGFLYAAAANVARRDF